MVKQATSDLSRGRRSKLLKILWLVAALLGLVLQLQVADEQSQDLTLRFDRPAADWERESLPIGNGALS